MRFERIGEDFRDAYRLFELKWKLRKDDDFTSSTRWLFFDDTLRDLFEMPAAQFWHAIINCMENHGVAYALVPLNATSITTNVSAMAILSRKPESLDSMHVCYLATRKEHRRRGLGTRLLQETVRRALHEQQNGVRNVVIQVNTLNTVALELYERCGWRCFAYLPGYLNPDPHHLTNHAYSLVLPLNRVKDVSTLCRDPAAIEIEPTDNQMSIEKCQRIPASF